MKKICVMGAGNAAFAISSDMSLAGHRVTLWEDEQFAEGIAEISQTKTITLTGASRTGDAILHKVTTDLADAVSDCEIVIVSLPAYAQELTARKLAGALQPGQIVFLCPGATGGALVFARVFHEAGLKDFKLCEVQTLPYSTRKTSSTGSNIKITIKTLYFAAFPAKCTEECYRAIYELYPNIKKAQNVLETALNNGNIVSHAPVMVLNAGRIGERFDYQHYKDGITPAVCRVLDGINEECMAICDAFGFAITTNAQRHAITGYTPTEALSSYESYRSSYSFMKAGGPVTLNHRYLTEDAPFSMVTLSTLATAIGIQTPLMDAIANLGGALMATNYWENGRTIDDLGLGGKTLEEMKAFLVEGYC